jgi:hypothetical protein
LVVRAVSYLLHKGLAAQIVVTYDALERLYQLLPHYGRQVQF